ncbi:hypothetical protein FRC12_019825 [Ceratobasidium sp. 428]|nr:hypothetical protein FRC12_019825 [Ceratobasidium sp. 428]
MDSSSQNAAQAQGGGAGVEANLLIKELRNSPLFMSMRSAVSENPGLIQPLLAQLAQSNPAIAQQMAQNPELLNQILSGTSPDGDGNDDIGEDERKLREELPTLSVTAEEADAIRRVSRRISTMFTGSLFEAWQLQALGFSGQQVMEAFVACGKDEELAANLLFEGSD